MVNDGNSSPGQARAKHLSAFAPRHRERTFGQHLHARQRLFLRHNTLTLYQVDFIISYEHLFVKYFLTLFRISHNARSLIFCVSFPINSPNFRNRAVRIDYEWLAGIKLFRILVLYIINYLQCLFF